MIDLLAIAISAIVAGVVMWLYSRRNKNRCPCGHIRSMHSTVEKRCTAETKRTAYDTSGTRVGAEYIKCPCLFYDGPARVEDN